MPGALAGYQNWLTGSEDGGQTTMRFYKPEGITTANVFCCAWQGSGSARTFSLQLHMGSVTNSTSLSPVMGNTPENKDEYTFDISSLATGWHDFEIFGRYTSSHGNNFLNWYCSQLTVMGT
jgi:hypothetical protein